MAPSFMKTNDRWRSRLPHWEVDGHWHFVYDPLPWQPATSDPEIRSKRSMIPFQKRRGALGEFSKLQRQYFMTAE